MLSPLEVKAVFWLNSDIYQKFFLKSKTYRNCLSVFVNALLESINYFRENIVSIIEVFSDGWMLIGRRQ